MEDENNNDIEITEEEIIISPEHEISDEVDVFEFSLDEEEIDELIFKLEELKETKQSLSFYIDEENELVINHAENDTLDGIKEEEE